MGAPGWPAADERFPVECLRLVAAAWNERPCVRKAVTWAPGTLAARWIAADARGELTSPAVAARVRAATARGRR
ncbi:MAG: hypothetical protein AB7O28_03365 [Vicinamibacterales bacterium]